MNPAQPIGIFDSGMGGLTVMRSVVAQLPHEDIIYFGDTAHLPYGDKSAATIQQYCQHIVDFLLEKNCKLILVACNSATAAAYDFLLDYIGARALLMGVIDPVVHFLGAHYQQKTIGLIGTRQTINSGVFAKKIALLPNQLTLRCLATPLLVPVIEENFHAHHHLIDELLALYLKQPALEGVEALILGCTHYPILKSRIAAFYHHKIPLLDAGELTAQALHVHLSLQGLLNPQTQSGRQQFYLSDLTSSFADMANNFFGRNVALQVIPLAFEDTR